MTPIHVVKNRTTLNPNIIFSALFIHTKYTIKLIVTSINNGPIIIIKSFMRIYYITLKNPYINNPIHPNKNTINFHTENL